MRAFVIAMENEAAEVRPFLRDDDRLYVAGVGKVNAAAAAQKAIDAGADEIINCGVAGGLDPAMEVGEAYEISQAVEYDFDLTLINGTKLGTHNERTTPYFDCRPCESSRLATASRTTSATSKTRLRSAQR